MRRNVFLFTALLIVPALAAQTAKLSPELRGLTGNGNVDVIIQYKRPPAQANNRGLLWGVHSSSTQNGGAIVRGRRLLSREIPHERLGLAR